MGVEGTELSKAEERAEPNAISCHSGCSSSSFYCFLLNTRFVLFFVWVCICEGEPGMAASLSATSCSSSSRPSAMGSWSAPGLGLRVPTWNGWSLARGLEWWPCEGPSSSQPHLST